MKRNHGGFTLVEFLVVVFIVGILSSLAFGSLSYSNMAGWEITNPDPLWETVTIPVENFRARSEEAAQKCIHSHYLERWTGQKPSACQPRKGVTGYDTGNIKQALEKKACERGWSHPSSNVLILMTGRVKGDVVESHPYLIRPEMCSS